MKYIVDAKVKVIPVDDVNPGDCYLFKGELYMRLQSYHKLDATLTPAVCIATGLVMEVPKSMEVEPVEVERLIVNRL
jgi:hypothetical protein